MVQVKMSFKRFLIWSSCGPPAHLCNFERGHHGEHSCEVIWNLDQWFRRRCRLRKRLRTDRRRTKTDHNSSPWAFGYGELKREIPAFLFQQGLHTRMLFFSVSRVAIINELVIFGFRGGEDRGSGGPPPPEESQVAIGFLRNNWYFSREIRTGLCEIRCKALLTSGHSLPPPLAEFSGSVNASVRHRHAWIQRGWTGGPGPLWKITKI